MARARACNRHGPATVAAPTSSPSAYVALPSVGRSDSSQLPLPASLPATDAPLPPAARRPAPPCEMGAELGSPPTGQKCVPVAPAATASPTSMLSAASPVRLGWGGAAKGAISSQPLAAPSLLVGATSGMLSMPGATSSLLSTAEDSSGLFVDARRLLRPAVDTRRPLRPAANARARPPWPPVAARPRRFLRPGVNTLGAAEFEFHHGFAS